MAKIAIVSLGFHGHVNPTLGIAEELLARGYDVAYFTATSLAGKVVGAGARFRPFGDSLSISMQQTAALALRDANRRFASYQTELQLAHDELEDALDAERPDLVLYGFIFPDALKLASARGIPAVRFFTTYAMNETFDIRQVFQHDEDTPPDSAALDFFARLKAPAPANLVFLPRAFQPFAETFDTTYHFVGPCIRRAETMGGGPVVLPASDKPLVVISLGTIFYDRPEFYRRCIDIFRDRDVQVVMSVGSDLAVEALGPLPDNIIAKAHISQVKLLAEAAVFIFHGGMNSTMEALSFGVPLIVIPQMAEQALTARRVAELGIGLHLGENMPTAEALEAAFDDVMENPQFRVNALAMRQEIEHAGGTPRAADILEERLAPSQRSSRRVSSCRTLSGMDTPSDDMPGST